MKEYKYTFGKFLRDWMLIISMAVGAGAYLLYRGVPALHPAGPALLAVCRTVQPISLFLMLFLSFSKIEPSQMRPHRWMLWLLLVQAGCFLAGAAALKWLAPGDLALEAAMLCLICPTATACAVVTGKLGGNMAGVITYTVLVNIMVAFLVPAVVPLIHPVEGLTFGVAFAKILSKVFPLLIMPCICAWVVRYLLPGFQKWLEAHSHWSFYIWAFSLALAILMSARGIYCSGVSAGVLASIAGASLLSCVFQFWAGKKIGARYGCRISAGQALGQKNTVFGIWMGYTFLDPAVSVAGGFYSLWHNCFNTWQLYRKRIGIL